MNLTALPVRRSQSPNNNPNMRNEVDRNNGPSPPAPVYSISRVRSGSPRIIIPHEDDTNLGAYEQNGRYGDSSTHTSTSVKMLAPVSGKSVPSDRLSTVRAVSPSGSQSQDPSRLSPTIQSFPRRKPLKENRNNSNSHKRIVSEASTLNSVDGGQDASKHTVRQVAGSDTDSLRQSENFEPLKYHHHALEEAEILALDKRASKLTVGTTHSDGSAGSDPHRMDAAGSSSARNSFLGQNLPRPDSGFSSHHELRGRTSSPRLSPYPRPTSRNSRSPDTRPLSYIDLLNVPYPQAAPSGAEHLVNSSLRNVVGNNASLLSTRKTLEMYRQNVKKTNDPAIQYEFAVFMIGAAQEEGLEEDNPINGPTSDKGQPNPREDLLKEAKHILQKLCDRSYPFAQYYLADGYASGLFNKGREDWDRAFPLFLAASKHGHAEAGYRTALCYEYGWGCRIDGMKAVQFYQHAASKNHPGAMLRLGRACLTGDMGLTKKYREGIRWLKRGAESADYQYNQAPYDLGCLHETGFGPDVFKDEAYAAQLYTKAADLGHVEANHRLGEAYEFGHLRCPKDPALSVHFYTGAAEHGHAPSQMALCAWYMVGVDNVLEKDESEAYEWAKRAAEQGLPKAQYTLGYFTEMGIGCRRDPLEANVWYVRAADQGEERAMYRIAAIRAAATGADPAKAAAGKKGKLTPSNTSDNIGTAESDKKKRFGIF